MITELEREVALSTRGVTDTAHTDKKTAQIEGHDCGIIAVGTELT